MNKNIIRLGMICQLFPNISLKMKLTTLFLILALLRIEASTYSQITKITLDLESVSIMTVFNEIEAKSEFKFLGNQDVIDRESLVSVHAKKERIDKILTDLFRGTDITFKIIDRQIILKREKPKTPKIKSPSTGLNGVIEQQYLVTGTITDENGTPLPGANIVEKGTSNGVTADFDGNFSISIENENAILEFSYIGFATKEIPLIGQTTITVIMQESASGLEEVVVVGYGSQKRINVTGSVSAVNSDQLTIAPVANVSNALAGRLPGLISKQESGKPGNDQANLSIRGFGAPLVIVDGIEADFNTIDANEIESITILKDASAAIYGSRAGNGVILVTRKRGKTGKPIIEYKSSWTFQGITKMPKLTNSGQRAELIREAWLNGGNPESTARFTQEDIDLFYAGTNPDYPNTDWAKIAIKDWAPQNQNNLSISGGSDKIKYYGFMGVLDQNTMFQNGGDYKRYNLQSNLDAKITENLSLQLDLTGIIKKSLTPNRDQNSGIWQEYWQSEPFWPATLPNGKLAYAGAGVAIGVHANTNLDYWPALKIDETDMKGTISLKYDFNQFIKGLSAKVLGNYSQYYGFQKSFSYLVDSFSYNYSNDTYSQWTSGTAPSLTHTDNKNLVLTGQFSLNFDRTFDQNHQVSALLVYEAIDYNSDWITAQRKNYITTTIPYLFAGSVDAQFADGRASEMGRQSYISRINYSYASKYLLESTIRVDKSAKFNKKNRTGIFPGVSLGWRLSEEDFVMDNIPALENLKLRVSYGEAGNDNVGNFQYLSGYNYGNTYIIGSAASTGLVASGLENPLLTWEKMTTYNAGMDFGLRKGKLYGELDFFYRDRQGIPGKQVTSVPTTFGATLPTVNLNSISTRGFDLQLSTNGKLNDLKWNVSANLSWSRSRWEYFDEPVYEDEDSKRLGQRTGRWTDVLFGYKSDGLFTSQEEIDALTYVYDETAGNVAVKPGAIRFLDTNKDGLLNWRDQVEIGKGTSPNWMNGLNINLNYKDFDFSALFQGAFGFYNSVSVRDGSLLQYNERWTEENNNRNAIVPRVGVAYTDAPVIGAPKTSGSSDFYLKKADYLRLKTMSIGYNIPNSLIDKINLEKFRIYLAGTNLLTFSGLNQYGIDPEAPDGLGGFYYPQMRTITFGFNLSF